MSAFAHASASWPQLKVSQEAFEAAWRRSEERHGGPLLQYAGDLYLATACLAGDAQALNALRALAASALVELRSFRLSSSDEQALLQDALSVALGFAGTVPKLLHYAAEGPLRAWLVSVMSRAALAIIKQHKREVELDEVILGSLPNDAAPELELVKERFRGTFSDSFRAAIAKLTPRQRNLLRQHYLDQLSLEALALTYRCHRATIARTLADARTTLLELTRDEISARLGVGRLEVDSLMKVVGSRLDISATFFLSRDGA